MSKLNKDEATAICVGNPNYVDLLKALPWAVPSRSWYELVQVKALSGIAPAVIIKCYEDREKLTQVKVNRIKKNFRFPQGEIIAGHQLKDDDEYITTLQGFWYTTLSRLQTGTYPLAPDDAPDIYKMYWIRELARNEGYVLKYVALKLDTSLSHAVTVASSLPNLDKIALVNAYDVNMPITKGQYMKSFDGYAYYHAPKTMVEERIASNHVAGVMQQYEEVFYGNQAEYEILYDLLYRLNCFGYLNDTLINGEYEMMFY